jgi:hypothetical protein
MSFLDKFEASTEEAKLNIFTTYEKLFSFELRSALAEWIEDKPWYELNQENPEHILLASNLVIELINEIESRAASETNSVPRLKLKSAARNLSDNYITNPFKLISNIKECLEVESKYFDGKNHENCLYTQSEILNNDINQQIEKIKEKSKETDELVNHLRQEIENSLINYQGNRMPKRNIQQVYVSSVNQTSFK